MSFPDLTRDPYGCPGTPDRSHLFALIMNDHCTACGQDREPDIEPVRLPPWTLVDRITVGVAVLAVLLGVLGLVIYLAPLS